jgi:hypothetical protein
VRARTNVIANDRTKDISGSLSTACSSDNLPSSLVAGEEDM